MTRSESLGFGRTRLAGALVLLVLAGCGGGGGGSSINNGGGDGVVPVEPPQPTTPTLTMFQDLPGVNVTILGLTGGSGAGGSFQVGDFVSVNYRLANDAGGALTPADLNTARMYISGPTTNYQIVIGSKSDLRAASTQNTDGSWTYKFSVPIPATYAASLNDTASFGASDGEMTGLPLVAGTYTLGFEGYKNFDVEKTTFRDAGNATFDFLFGGATTLEHREVVTQANCNQCHKELRAHGEFRRDVKLCVLCHTSGGEDKNVATAANGTPGASIDFRVMIHKIHNGFNLPSVQGVGVNPDGSPNYEATVQPYELVGFGNSVIDFSEVKFPVWPNLSTAMPRNYGYTQLTSGQKTQNDNIRKGVTACAKCHGVPEGGSVAPAQGNNCYTNASRRACGACHDDIDWTLPYQKNLLTMPAQPDDSACANCHSTPNVLPDNQAVHLHPVKDPALATGVNVAVTNLTDTGVMSPNGKIDPGEKVQFTVTITKDDGSALNFGSVANLTIGINGPTTNRNMIHLYSIPIAGLPANTNTTTFNMPDTIQYEPVGTASATANETFTTARGSHWNVTGALTTVNIRTATSTTTSLGAAALQAANYIDTVSNAGFAQGNILVIDDGNGTEEYQKVQTVDADGKRIWFGSPTSFTYQWGIKFAHALGASVKKVTLTAKTVGTDFTVNAGAGSVTEVTEFGAGNRVLVSYTGDFIMPAVYPEAINGTPDVGLDQGKWTSKPIISGTYEFGAYAYANLVYAAYNETQTYRVTSEPAIVNFLVGTATTVETFPIIDSLDNCNKCHDDVYFHGGGRRSVSTCFLCHGTSGFEDRPKYVAPNVPTNPIIGLDFRSLLHKIHAGEQLDDLFYGYFSGSGAYPNNWSATYHDPIAFPATEGVRSCRMCHGETSTAYYAPHTRDYPGATTPSRVWKKVCNACHNGTEPTAHMDSNTAPNGAESCAVCHGAGTIQPVSIVHKTR